MESDVVKACKRTLDYWKSKGVVIDYDRNNSGKIRISGRWIQLHKPGTPDITAYLCIEGSIFVYFIECKYNKGKQTEEQLDFEYKFKGINNCKYELVTNPRQIDATIELLTNYTKKELDGMTI